jgi:hypothetical protein
MHCRTAQDCALIQARILRVCGPPASRRERTHGPCSLSIICLTVDTIAQLLFLSKQIIGVVFLDLPLSFDTKLPTMSETVTVREGDNGANILFSTFFRLICSGSKLGHDYELYTLHSLPAEVLNPSEIDILDIMAKLDACKEKRLGIHFCYNLEDGHFVKISGPRLSGGFEEARIMDFIRVRTKIPVPRVRMVFERDGLSYTVVDYIDGKELHLSYSDHSLAEVEDIARQLKDIIHQLRAIPLVPPSTLGTWESKPFQNIWFSPLLWDIHVTPSSVFQSVADFNLYWIKRSKLEILLPWADPSKIVLSHGDLNSTNIIVRDGKIVSIVDWDTFGWYPDFWELLPPRSVARGSTKWQMALDSIFGPKTDFSSTYMKILDAAFEEPFQYELDLAYLGIGNV